MSMKSLATRIQYLGGDSLGRINRQKLQSMRAALENDYNSRMAIIKGRGGWRCLINNYLLKPDYDRKVLSIVYDAHLEPGDTFEIADDGTHWMVYLPDLVETAYLKSEIIRCRYTLWVDGIRYWIYFQGPTETTIQWQGKRNLEYNELNYSGTIFIKNNPSTKEFFKRFTKIKLDGHVWRVTVTDPISVPGILELEVEEYFDNTPEELPEITKEADDSIIGKSEGKPEEILGYTINPALYNPDALWEITDNRWVKIIGIYEEGRTCKVKILDGAIGTFTLTYGDITKTVEIDISEPVIKGPQEVHPYDVHTYFVVYPTEYDNEGNVIDNPVLECSFAADPAYARIVEQADNYCKLEIVRGKKGEFVLTADADGTTYYLPITIKSF